MMRRRFGRIIGITSVVGLTGNPGQGNYTASKAGMVGMIKSVAAEYAKRNVTANCIAPGLIASAMTDKLNDKQREAIFARVPAAKLGTPEDVAAAAVYLASERGRICDWPDNPRQWRDGHDIAKNPETGGGGFLRRAMLKKWSKSCLSGACSARLHALVNAFEVW